MQIPIDKISKETLDAIIEAYVLQEGTEYGEQNVSLDTKIKQIKSQLDKGLAFIVYDQASESCNIVSKEYWQKMQE